MNSATNDIVKQNKVFSCIDCGKCVSSCPLAKAGEDFSPQVIIEKALLGFSFLEDKELWFCFTCQACTQRCPSNVRYAEFVEAARRIAIKEGITKYSSYCKHCGKYLVTTPILEYYKKLIKEVKLGEESLMLCPRCKRRDVAEKCLLVSARGEVLFKR